MIADILELSHKFNSELHHILNNVSFDEELEQVYEKQKIMITKLEELKNEMETDRDC